MSTSALQVLVSEAFTSKEDTIKKRSNVLIKGVEDIE